MKKILMTAVMAAALSAPMATPAVAQESVYVPLLTYRTGAFADSGTPVANGLSDYFSYVNKNGGVNGVKIDVEECETGYKTDVGVECYERLKSKNPIVVNPYSTGITNAIIPKTIEDKIPVLSMGYGLTPAADGSVFPWVFNFPTTYWSQASAFIRYVGAQEGGMDNLKGKKIALVYHNSAYGKEPISTLETLAKKYGYELTLLAVDHPGQEQRATWLQIRRLSPDWVFMWGWGVMNQVAVKEAASINFPMDHFIGVWWSGSEVDVLPAGDGAIGYKAGTFHAPGGGFKVHADIRKYVHDKGMGT
ncbi:MAG: ABC transporter substrate-binding protein, partial [Proteobacteria bacterium]|nr:ABC transporter substrate-binding protein [Pseudomonadota bacterium]